MDSSDSFQIDEHLARLLAAYDQGIEGGDGKAPTIGVPRAESGPHSPLPGEKLVGPLNGSRANVGLASDLLPDTSRGPANLTPRPITITPSPGNGVHRIGRFELRRQLGKGGCGIVFLAFDPKLEREVALKIPRPEMLLSPDARRRLVREALAAAEFDHPNLVPVYETGEIGPICFIATAFCPGLTLGEWLEKQAFPIPVRQAARLIAIVAEAVQHAHDRGVLHRDLKPNNVILQPTKDDPQEQEAPPGSCQLRGEHYVPRVVDFGLAKLLERGGPSDTNTRQVLGTPKYMAPEQAQARHDDVGPTADVYALGVILYEMLAGCAPYEGATDVEVLRQAIDGKLKLPRHIRQDIPRDLEAICLKAMERSPAKRYRTAIDLADDLRRFLDGKPTIARPLQWPGRAVRWFRRNDQVVALAVLTLIATVLLGVGTWYMRQTRQLQDDQDRVARQQAERMQSDLHHESAKSVRDAFLAWRGGNLVAANVALERARQLVSSSGQTPDFALRYLATLAKGERVFIVCPAGAVISLAVSADGKRIASGHADGTLALWDRATGQQLASIKAYGSEVTQLAFALGDTRLFSIGGQPTTTETGLAWAVSSSGQLAPAPATTGFVGTNVACLALSQDGEVVYLGAGSTLQKVSLRDSNQNRTTQLPGESLVTALSLTANGNTLLVGTASGTVMRFSSSLAPVGEGREHRAPITALLATGDGRTYRVGTPDGIARVEPNGTVAVSSTRGRVHWMVSVPEFGFAASHSPGAVMIGDIVRHDLMTGDVGDIRAGAMTSDGTTLFTAGDDGIIRSWQLSPDLRDRGVWSGITPLAIGINPEGRRIAVSTPRAFRDRFGTKDETHISTPERGFAALWVPKEGATLGVELRDRLVILREISAAPSKELARFTLTDDAKPVSAHFSADGGRVAVGDDRGRVSVWNAHDRSLVATIDCGHRSQIERVALSDDGRLIAALGPNTILICSVGDSNARITVAAEDQPVFRFLPSGDYLASAGRSGVVRIWHITDGREDSALYGHVGRVTAMSVSRDGRNLITGGATGEVKLWDIRSGQELISMRRHSTAVTFVELSADGSLMVTGGEDQLAIWEVRE